MGWLGSAVLILSGIIPGVRSLSPTAMLEFAAKVGPRVNRFFIGMATSTIVFGLALLFTLGIFITKIYIGAGLGLVAYVDGMFVTIPSFMKADRLAKAALAGSHDGPPPPELVAALKRGGIGVATTALLLVLTLAFMVATGFPF